MLNLNTPKCPTENLLPLFSGVVYVNALDLLPSAERYSHGAIALKILLVHRVTGEEKLIDLLAPNDRFSTVQKIISLHFPSGQWLFAESWESAIAEPTLAVAA